MATTELAAQRGGGSVGWSKSMKQQIGFFMQLVVLGALPALIYYELTIGFELIMMPLCLLIGVVLFSVGTWLRGS